MAESVTVEVWEYQNLYRQTWTADEDHAWTYKNFEKCYPPEEISLPSPEWCWATNWRIDCRPGSTDSEGWEYAGKFVRFKIPNRKPKPEQSWNSRARRRMWSRVMRREAGISIHSSTDLNKALPRIQSGLSSILQARIQIESILKKDPDAMSSLEMKSLIDAVRKNIADILTALDQCDDQQPSLVEQAKIKKLRNDLLKEQLSIEKVINPSFVDKSKQSSKRASITGRQSFTIRDTVRPSESFSRFSEAVSSKSGGSASDPSSRKNPFDADYEGDAMEIPSSLPDTQNSTPTPSFLGNDPKNGIVRSNGVISSYDQSSSKNNSVKGGTAGAFDPSVLAAKSKNPYDMGLNDNWETPKDGVFIDRNMQELMIEQKLRPVDEATVMQSIIEEREVEIRKIHKGIVQVQDMFIDLSRIVKEQQVEIDKIFENVEASHSKTEDAFKNIVKAEKLQRSGNCIIS